MPTLNEAPCKGGCGNVGDYSTGYCKRCYPQAWRKGHVGKMGELTKKQTLVLRTAATCPGMTVRELGRLLNMDKRLVDAHLGAIYKRLDVKNRAQAAIRARELGLI